jgi:hypothetical protein
MLSASRGTFLLIAFAGITGTLVYLAYEHKQTTDATVTEADNVDNASINAINEQNIEPTNIPTEGELPVNTLTEAPEDGEFGGIDGSAAPVQTNAAIVAASQQIAGTA